jgi:hypothetical protein
MLARLDNRKYLNPKGSRMREPSPELTLSMGEHNML